MDHPAQAAESDDDDKARRSQKGCDRSCGAGCARTGTQTGLLSGVYFPFQARNLDEATRWDWSGLVLICKVFLNWKFALALS